MVELPEPVVELPSGTSVAEPDEVVEPHDDPSNLFEETSPVEFWSPPVTAVSEEAEAEDKEGVVEEGCRWETAAAADVFGEYMMANVVCIVRAPAPATSDELSDVLLAFPSDTGAAAGVAAGAARSSEPEFLEARFGWRCTAGATGNAIDSPFYSREHTGRLEVFASNGGPPQTLQFEQARPGGPYEAPTRGQTAAPDQAQGLSPQADLGVSEQPGDAGPAREAAVLVRFGSDHRPFIPSAEVVVVGADLPIPEGAPPLVPSVANQRITYGGLWRNSEGRPPRDRAGVVSVLEDRNFGGRYDLGEFETSQEHSRHDEHLLYAPDEMAAPITAALLRDESGRLHTAIAGIYIDFDVSGWEDHVGPVLEACWFRDVPAAAVQEPAEAGAAGATAGSEDNQPG